MTGGYDDSDDDSVDDGVDDGDDGDDGKWKMEMISLDRWRTRKTTLLGNTSNLRDSRRGPTCSAVQYLVDEKLYLTNLS